MLDAFQGPHSHHTSIFVKLHHMPLLIPNVTSSLLMQRGIALDTLTRAVCYVSSPHLCQ